MIWCVLSGGNVQQGHCNASAGCILPHENATDMKNVDEKKEMR